MFYLFKPLVIVLFRTAYTSFEVITLYREMKEEKQEQKKQQAEFNSITMKDKVENQNQTHNSRREGIGPENQRR